MKSQERMKFWHQHVEAQKLSRVSIAVYCEREKVSTYSFYQWRKRLSSSARAPALRSSGFASVEVVGQPASQQSANGGAKLPDPRWAAAFVSHLLREWA